MGGPSAPIELNQEPVRVVIITHDESHRGGEVMGCLVRGGQEQAGDLRVEEEFLKLDLGVDKGVDDLVVQPSTRCNGFKVLLDENVGLDGSESGRTGLVPLSDLIPGMSSEVRSILCLLGARVSWKQVNDGGNEKKRRRNPVFLKRKRVGAMLGFSGV